MPAITADLVPKLEGATGHKLVITTDAFPGLMKRIEAGETADVILLPAPGIAALVKQGKAAEGDVP